MAVIASWRGGQVPTEKVAANVIVYRVLGTAPTGTTALKLNSALNGLGASGPFFADRIAS